MASTSFTNGVTLTEAAWFNDVDTVVYDIFGDGTNFVAGALKLGTSGMTVTGTAAAWGFGVTPSAWSQGRAAELGPYAGNGIWAAGSQNDVRLVSNFYYNSGNKFAATGYAQVYQRESGAHTWLTSSASGTAGNTATMNTLMTLSAAGILASGRIDLNLGAGGLGNIVNLGTYPGRSVTNATNALNLVDGTAPSGTMTNGVTFYSASGEARVMDAAGNSTLLSPHDKETNEWIFDSVDSRTGRHLRIDMERMLKFLNDKFGTDFVKDFTP